MNKVLSFNSHTAYSYLLSKTGFNFDICGKWDKDERPIPSNVHLVNLDEAIANIKNKQYKTIITHHRKDLFTVLKYLKKDDSVKLIYVTHGRYQRRGTNNSNIHKIAKFGYKHLLKILKKIYNINFVFITPCSKVSWDMDGFVIMPGVDINDFKESDFSINKLLVVGNNLHRHYFRFNLLKKLLKAFPTEIDVVGFNPKIPESKKAASFEDLLSNHKTHKAYLYLADEPEEGFNLSLLEAMASGLPVITMYHPTSPIIHGYNGLVAFNEEEYFKYCDTLLKDENLARKLGQNARETVKIYFSINEFTKKWRYIIEK